MQIPPDTLEIGDKITKFLPEITIDWLRDSELAEDEITVEVIESLRLLYNCYGLDIGDDVMLAIGPAALHRAPEIATDPEGDPIEDYADIPGDIQSMGMDVLRGHETRAAMEEHCSSVEARVAACILNTAARWADGGEAYKWTKQTIADEEYPRYPNALAFSKKVSALEDIETTVLDT